MDKRLFYSTSLSNYHVLEWIWKERGMFFALGVLALHQLSCPVRHMQLGAATGRGANPLSDLTSGWQLSKAIQDLVGTLLINLR